MIKDGVLGGILDYVIVYSVNFDCQDKESLYLF